MVDAAEIVVNAYARLKAPRARAAFRPTNTNILLLPLLVRGASDPGSSGQQQNVGGVGGGLRRQADKPIEVYRLVPPI